MVANPPRYIISKYGDPLFAISIGLSAALLRIQREEVEKRSGIPSTSSFVVSDAQRKHLEYEKELRHRKLRAKAAEMERSGEEYQAHRRGVLPIANGVKGSANVEKEVEIPRANVSYAEIIQLGWERLKWKVDWEWNGRGKEFERKDGRLV